MPTKDLYNFRHIASEPFDLQQQRLCWQCPILIPIARFSHIARQGSAERRRNASQATASLWGFACASGILFEEGPTFVNPKNLRKEGSALQIPTATQQLSGKRNEQHTTTSK